MQNDVKLQMVLKLVEEMEDGQPDDRVRVTDSRDGTFYRHDERIRTALKVALITGRPLLLVGPSGCGKSSLAPYVARNLRLHLLTYTVTETAEASDLLWRIDYVQRLNDAQVHQIKPITEYVEPGVLWRAFTRKDEDELNDLVSELGGPSRHSRDTFDPIESDSTSTPDGQSREGQITEDLPVTDAPIQFSEMFDTGLDQAIQKPENDAFGTLRSNKKILGSLVLIDEIDKASASFANSLLVAVGSLQFDVPPLNNLTVKAEKDSIVLVVMTSNEERELPPALTRRCVVLPVRFPKAGELVQITRTRWPMWMADKKFEASVVALAESLTDEVDDRPPVSTAEFLDLVQVLKATGAEPESEVWRMVEGLVLLRPEVNED